MDLKCNQYEHFLRTIKRYAVKVLCTFTPSAIFVELNLEHHKTTPFVHFLIFLSNGKGSSYRNQIQHELFSYGNKQNEGVLLRKYFKNFSSNTSVQSSRRNNFYCINNNNMDEDEMQSLHATDMEYTSCDLAVRRCCQRGNRRRNELIHQCRDIFIFRGFCSVDSISLDNYV